jgi:hypothetical protein
MLNLHLLADELNRDRLARAEHQHAARQLRSQRRLGCLHAASQVLNALRQAISQIDAIIESARNRPPETACSDEHASSRTASTESTTVDTRTQPQITLTKTSQTPIIPTCPRARTEHYASRRS